MSPPDADSQADGEIAATDVISRAQLTKVGTSDYGDLYECPRCGESVTEYRTCSKCGWDGMSQDGYPAPSSE